MKPVKKAVIPVAGLGTRFLPATKAVPKELLPIVDIPAIQVVVEEVVASGIEEVILITGRGKEAILGHFDYSYELEHTLEQRGKTELLSRLRNISEMVRAVAVPQKNPLGLGHAVLCAKSIVGDNPFMVILPDDIIDNSPTATQQLIQSHEQYGTGVVAVKEVPPEDTHMYGVISGDRMGNDSFRINGLIEKPAAGNAPSNFAVIGRYLLPPSIFDYLEDTTAGHGGEIQLTDALQKLAANEGLVGHIFEGRRHDIGDKLGFLKANVEYALGREEFGPTFREYLVNLLKEG